MRRTIECMEYELRNGPYGFMNRKELRKFVMHYLDKHPRHFGAEEREEIWSHFAKMFKKKVHF